MQHLKQFCRLNTVASVSSYTVETGHTIAHDTVVTSPVIQQTVHAPVYGSVPIVGQVPVLPGKFLFNALYLFLVISKLGSTRLD